MIELKQIARGRIETPQASVARDVVVFIKLWIEMRRAVAGTVTGENNSPVRAVARHHVVVVRGLIENLHYPRNDVRVPDHRSEICDFVDLPEKLCRVVSARGRADDH